MNKTDQMFRLAALLVANRDNWEGHFFFIDRLKKNGEKLNDMATQVNMGDGWILEDASVYVGLAEMAFPDRTFRMELDLNLNGETRFRVYAF